MWMGWWKRFQLLLKSHPAALSALCNKAAALMLCHLNKQVYHQLHCIISGFIVYCTGVLV
jgi:hypothetical protein